MSVQSDPNALPPNARSVNTFREYFSSILAFVIVGAFLLMVAVTLPVAFNGNDEALTRAKDLLSLVSPFAGMVIGYYFNKATSDARSENAEQNARTATASAQKAALDRERADELARKAEQEKQEMRTDLLEMWTAANEMVNEMSGISRDQIQRGLTPPGLDNEADSAVGGNKTMWKLQEALKRAEKWK